MLVTIDTSKWDELAGGGIADDVEKLLRLSPVFPSRVASYLMFDQHYPHAEWDLSELKADQIQEFESRVKQLIRELSDKWWTDTPT